MALRYNYFWFCILFPELKTEEVKPGPKQDFPDPVPTAGSAPRRVGELGWRHGESSERAPIRAAAHVMDVWGLRGATRLYCAAHEKGCWPDGWVMPFGPASLAPGWEYASEGLFCGSLGSCCTQAAGPGEVEVSPELFQWLPNWFSVKMLFKSGQKLSFSNLK